MVTYTHTLKQHNVSPSPKMQSKTNQEGKKEIREYLLWVICLSLISGNKISSSTVI